MDGNLNELQRFDPGQQSVVEAKQVRLVPFTDEHMRNPAYIGWLRDPDVVAPLNLPRYLLGDVADDEIREYCKTVMRSPNDWFYAIELREGDDFIGTVKAGSINRYSGTIDLGIMIGRKELWGTGLASDALSALASHLIGECGIRRLTAGAMSTNVGMIRVFEKLGFRREGVFRQHDRIGDMFIDHIHLGCLADELQA